MMKMIVLAVIDEKERERLQTTPWSAYTPGMVLELCGFVLRIFLILFGLTLICIACYFCAKIVREHFRGKPMAAFEKKAAAAIQTADMGWAAIICGPLFGVVLFMTIMPISLIMEPRAIGFSQIALAGILLIAIASIAGVITAAAFWVSSAVLGNVRKAAKRLGGVRDPEFDGPV